MPRYYFHVQDGETILDKEGTELAGFDEARAEAVVLSGAMLRDAGRKFWNNGEWRLRSLTKRARQFAPCALPPSTLSGLGCGLWLRRVLPGLSLRHPFRPRSRFGFVRLWRHSEHAGHNPLRFL